MKDFDGDEVRERAHAHDESGQQEHAERLCRQALVDAPADAHYRLGLDLEEQNRLKEAEACFREVLALDPDHADAWIRLGHILIRRAAWAEAETCFRRAIAVVPKMVEAYYNLGVILQKRRRLEEAAHCYRQAIVLNPAVLQAGSGVGRVLGTQSFSNLGNVLSGQGRAEEAIVCYHQALTLDPNHAPTHNNLGNQLKKLGRLAEAIACFARGIELDPEMAQLHFNLANALSAQDRLDDAIASYRRALELDPRYAEALINLGNLLLWRQGRNSEALAAYDRALELKPHLASAHLNRGNALKNQGRLAEALAAYDRALELKPHLVSAHVNRGNAFKDQARFPEAIAAYREALRLNPNSVSAYSNYLFCLNYDPAQDDATLAEAHRLWGESHPPLPEAFTSYSSSRDPEKRLRVGMVSADFRHHPVGYFLDRVLAAADPDAVHYVCYSEVLCEDKLTERLRSNASGWRSTVGLSDRDLAELIRADGIDIITDLAGHTADNRLGCFAFRPAPVQVHWAGYCHSVPIMDYSIWDPIQVPEGEECRFVERIIRLPDLRWCYRAPAYAPAVSDPPMLRRGYVTFGSFNNLSKVNAEVIDLWALVLKAVPGSRLFLNWWTLKDPNECARLAAAFCERGLDPRRLELTPGAGTHAGTLAEYSEVDIALDPFPFSGCLTTCEALWMGLPVVTLPRSRPVSRQSQAFLTAIGRKQWIAKDADDYVRIAASLGSDPRHLAALRRGQRARMAASPICNGPRFARNLETVYRTIWREWCSRPQGSPRRPKADAVSA